MLTPLLFEHPANDRVETLHHQAVVNLVLSFVGPRKGSLV